jgi:hypothetical protein
LRGALVTVFLAGAFLAGAFLAGAFLAGALALGDLFAACFLATDLGTGDRGPVILLNINLI